MELSNGWHEAIVSGTIAAAWVFSLIGGFLSGTKTYANSRLLVFYAIWPF